MTSFIESICPECVFKPTYPQVFKFDLILYSQNYGELEIVINKNDEISEIKGDTEAVKKFDEIAKKADKQRLDGFFPFINVVSYPPKKLLDLLSVFWKITSDFTLEQNNALENKDYLKMCEFFYNFYKPINEKILYKKTGIKIQY